MYILYIYIYIWLVVEPTHYNWNFPLSEGIEQRCWGHLHEIHARGLLQSYLIPSKPSSQSHVSRYIKKIHPKWTVRTPIWRCSSWKDPFFFSILFSGDIQVLLWKTCQIRRKTAVLLGYATQLHWLFIRDLRYAAWWFHLSGATAASVRRRKTPTTKCWLAMGYDGYASVPRNLQKHLHFWEPRILQVTLDFPTWIID